MRLGILDFNPIQYRAPLYQRVASRGNIDVNVLYLSDFGYRSYIDPGFGTPVAWNIDLLSGYANEFLTVAGDSLNISQRSRRLAKWLGPHDVVLVHGYANPWMLLATAICRARGVQYLVRGESHPGSRSTGLRRCMREVLARTVVSASAGGVAIGQLNEEFYRQYGAPRITLAPYSVDDERFARPPQLSREQILERWGLDSNLPILMFSGKLIPRKRPLDLATAAPYLSKRVNTLFVGDGSIADAVRAVTPAGTGVVTGFVNQSELPSYYHAADLLVLPSEDEPWGLVVNEAMAAGVLPVVSDRVGAAPDLVQGLGEVYPCGDIQALVAAITRALITRRHMHTKDRVRARVSQFSLERTAMGLEKAVLALSTGSNIAARTRKSRHNEADGIATDS